MYKEARKKRQKKTQCKLSIGSLPRRPRRAGFSLRSHGRGIPLHMDDIFTVSPPTVSSVSVDAAGAAVNVGVSPKCRFRGVTGEAGVTEESDSVARGLMEDKVWIRQQGDAMPWLSYQSCRVQNRGIGSRTPATPASSGGTGRRLPGPSYIAGDRDGASPLCTPASRACSSVTPDPYSFMQRAFLSPSQGPWIAGVSN